MKNFYYYTTPDNATQAGFAETDGKEFLLSWSTQAHQIVDVGEKKKLGALKPGYTLVTQADYDAYIASEKAAAQAVVDAGRDKSNKAQGLADHAYGRLKSSLKNNPAFSAVADDLLIVFAPPAELLRLANRIAEKTS